VVARLCIERLSRPDINEQGTPAAAGLGQRRGKIGFGILD
jgi:hypothetical protein